VCCFLDPLAFPLVVDTCVLQPPIATSGETASAPQVLPKGPVVRACWCIVRVEPWVCPCANKPRPSVVWTSALIKKVKRVDNAMSREIDHWFDSTIGGYITKFSIDRVESYRQAERYFFKGPRGKFLHFLKLKINMLLHEKNILKIQ
jgi:hypothetical protein